MTVSLAKPNAIQMDRSAWLVLVFALVFILLDGVQLAYRFTLPTEGWLIGDLGPGARDYPMSENLVGAPSPLRPGDALRLIGGVPAELMLSGSSFNLPRPADWEIGGQVPVTALRNGQTLVFELPIVQWTLASWWRHNLANSNNLAGWLAMLTLFGVGLVTFLKRPGVLAARYLFVFGVAWLAITLSGSLPDALGKTFNPFASFAAVVFSNVSFSYLLGPSLLGFALTFPRPKAFIQRRPGLLVAPYLVGALAPAALLVSPILATIGFPLTLGMILLAIAALVHSGRTMRDAISQAQLRWAIGGVVAGLTLFTLNYVTIVFTGFPKIALLAAARLGFPVIGLSLAVAIFRYRLFDIDFLIRRTLVYSALTALLALTYFGLIIVLQGVVGAFGGARSEWITVASTLAVAALVLPLRNRVQAFIDRRFFRRKYDAAKTLAAFAVTARDETDLNALTARLALVVDETLQPENVSVWLRETPRPRGDGP